MGKGFLFLLLILEWNRINTSGVTSQQILTNSNELTEEFQKTVEHQNQKETSIRLKSLTANKTPLNEAKKNYVQDNIIRQVSKYGEVSPSKTKILNINLSTNPIDTEHAISDILNEFKDQLSDREPFRIILNASVPQYSNQQYVNNITAMLERFLRSSVPTSTQKSVEVIMQKSVDGYITNLKIIITTNAVNSKIKYLAVDLSIPGINIRHAILTTLITVIKSSILSKNDNIRINLLIKPPIGADKFLQQNITNTVKSVLDKLVKQSDISINTSYRKKYDGSITGITYQIVIGSNSAAIMKHINLDLSKAGSNFTIQIRDILATIKQQVEPIITGGKSATLNVEIQPPENLGDDFSKEIYRILSTELEKTFSNRIKINTDSIKYQQDIIKSLSFIITIEPDIAIVDIDLSKSMSNLKGEVDKVLSIFMKKINDEYAHGGIIAFNLNVQLPKGSNNYLIDETVKRIQTYITQSVINKNSGVHSKITKDINGNNINLVIVLIIEPKEIPEDDKMIINLDMSVPKYLGEEVNKNLANLTTKIHQRLIKNMPVELKFIIELPNGSDEVFMENTSKMLLIFISEKFPYNEIKSKADITKDSRGNISQLSLTFTIQPNSGMVIKINLTKSRNDLIKKIDQILPKIKNELRKNQFNGESVFIYLNIQLRELSDERLVENITETIVSILSHQFSSYLVSANTETYLETQDFNLKNIYVVLTIKPKRNSYKVNLNLSEPGLNLTAKISNILFHLKPQLKEIHSEGHSMNFILNIYTAKKSGQEFVNDTKINVLTMMSRKFSNNKITVHVKEDKDSEGNVLLLRLFFSIKPLVTDIDSTPTNATWQRVNSNSTDSKTYTSTSIEKTISSPTVAPDERRVPIDNTSSPSRQSFNYSTSRHSKKNESVANTIETKFTNFIENTINSSTVEPDERGVPVDTSSSSKSSMNYSIPRYTETDESTSSTNMITDATSIAKPNGRANNPSSKTGFEETETTQKLNDEQFTHNVNLTDINLTESGINFNNTLNEKLLNVVSNINNEIQNGSPVTLNFNITPPGNSSEGYINVISQNILLTVKKYFPANHIKITTNARKNYEGYLSDIRVVINIKPFPGISTDKIIVIDMPNLKVSLNDYISETLSKVKHVALNNLSNGLPFKMNFAIKPPSKSRQEFLKVITEKIENIMKENFESNKVNVIMNSKKTNPQGDLSDISFQINIEPVSESQPIINQTIDLSKSGVNKNIQINKTLSDVIPDIKNYLKANSTVSLYFNVKPPEYSKEDYLKVIAESISSALKNYLPNNNMTLKIKSQVNAKGYLGNINLEINIETSPQFELIGDGINIDLTKPGASLNVQINDKLSDVIPDIENDLKLNSVVTLHFNVKPPAKSSGDYLEVISKSVLSTLRNNFPTNNITLKINSRENAQGYLDNIYLEINIQPSTQITHFEKGIDIDFSQPGGRLNVPINETLSDLITDVKHELKDNSTVTLHFNIRPPMKSSQEYAKKISESLLSTLRNSFPTNNITLKIKSKKGAQGYLGNISLEMKIEPIRQTELIEKDINIDLSKPGDNLNVRVNEIVSELIPAIRNDLKVNSTKTLHFNVKPPSKSSDDNLKIISESKLKNHFPTNNITLKINSKDAHGYLNNIPSDIRMHNSSQNQHIEKDIDIDLYKPQDNLKSRANEIVSETIPTVKNDLKANSTRKLHFKANEDYLKVISEIIDLSEPGIILEQQINKTLSTVISNNNDALKTNQTLNIHFNFKPPEKSTHNYVDVITKSAIHILTEYFPDNKISTKTTFESDHQGYLNNIDLDINVNPSEEQRKGHNIFSNSSESGQTVRQQVDSILPNQSTFEPYEENVNINLSESGNDLKEQVDKFLFRIINNVNDNIRKDHPVLLKFNITPSGQSTLFFLKTTEDSIISILKKYFPNDAINVETIAPTNSLDYLTEIILKVKLGRSTEDNSKYVDIDLSNSKTIQDQIENKMLPYLVRIINEYLQKKNPITLKLTMKPPEAMSENYLQQMPEEVSKILAIYFPNYRIIVSIQNYSKEHLSDIVLQIGIEATESQGPIVKYINTGKLFVRSNLVRKITEHFDDIAENLKKNSRQGRSTELNFDIRLGKKKTSYLSKVLKIFAKLLSKYFPNNTWLIKIQTQKSQEKYLDRLIVKTSVEQSTGTKIEANNENLELPVPAVPLREWIHEILLTRMSKIKIFLNNGKSFSLSLNIITHSNELTKPSPTQVIEEIMEIISNYFPPSWISVNAEINKNIDKIIDHIFLKLTIRPAIKKYRNLLNVDLDLRFFSSIKIQMRKELPKILAHAEKFLIENEPISLIFKIKYPIWWRKNYRNNIWTELVSLLSQQFSDSQIEVKTRIKKKPPRDLLIIIHPAIDESLQNKERVNVHLDFSSPGNSLATQMTRILPEVIANITKSLGKKRTLVNFEIKPPPRAKKNFVEYASNALIPYITNIFPGYEVTIEANDDDNGSQNGRTVNVAFDVATWK